MSYILFSLSVLLLISSGCGNARIQKTESTSDYTRITLRNDGDDAVSLGDYGLTVEPRSSGGGSRRLHPLSTDVLQPAASFRICHPDETEGCDVVWSGLKYKAGDNVELTKGDNVVDSKGGFPGVNRDPLSILKTDTTGSDGDRPKDNPGDESLDVSDSRQSNQEFDDRCWPIRSQLSSFRLDSCQRPIPRESVTIGTFNALFLFDGVDDRVSVWSTEEEADAHLRRIANLVRQNHPDILVLQEVENRDMLERLISAVERPVYTPYFVQGRDSWTGQDVALITQGDWVRSLTRTDCRSGQVPGSSCGASMRRSVGVSKNLIALFDSCLFGFKFAIVGLHFYARPTASRPCIKRESQARVIQDVVSNLIDAGFEVMVMGDLNDYSDRYEDVYIEEGPLSRVMAMMRDPNGDGVDELDNVMRKLPQERRYTAWWDKDEDGQYPGISEASQIDHILMTRRLFGLIEQVWIDHDMDPEAVSDHWPMFVRLSTRRAVDEEV